MGFKVVIPARYASTRLPAKPLVDLGGRPMIQWVIDGACRSGADEVLVALGEKFGRKGKRFAQGFYDYPPDAKKHLWPGLAEHFPQAAQQPAIEEVKTRLLYRQALESARCLEEGVLRHAEDGDVGSIFGIGFPAWTGGTLSFIDTVGLARFVAECDRLADRYGERFRVSDALRERAANNLLSLEWASDAAGGFRTFLGISHLDDPDLYLRHSPVSYVKECTTPLLIIHSEGDLRCPVEQADQLFVALRLLQRDVEMVRFAGESHELSRSGSPAHRRQRMEIILDFFGRHADFDTRPRPGRHNAQDRERHSANEDQRE